MIAALFVDPAGPYPTIDGVDCWDQARDARRYPGPHSVVAHPPCQLWVNFAALNFKRYGGEHNRPGNDGGCFASAYHNVLLHGGVLEHPAGSNAWEFYGLAKPTREGWSPAGNGWVCEVWQSSYGHLARKRTWLFYNGWQRPLEADWRRGPGTHQCGWFDRIKPTLSKREASRTPPPPSLSTWSRWRDIRALARTSTNPSAFDPLTTTGDLMPTSLPTASDLYTRPDLVPLDEIADRLAEAIRGTDAFLRKSTVSVTFGVTFNVDLQRLEITTAVKSKRPVKEDRNEEVIGDEGFVFAIKKEIPGQSRLPGTEERRVGKDAAAGVD